MVHGRAARRPRSIRTVEGWELTSLVVGCVEGRRPEGDGLLVVCAGTGSSGSVARLSVGEEVVVLGRLVPRRAARPEDDTIELLADAVLARRPPAAVSTAAEPRIAP
ncbi:hypothetical protein [Clavibacter sp. VKM Ac-2872]|uniref:hypothetical protein n=1 Tax=Clavibacter sp. VKM Ac-2872 TaxID=2783812 RepID=UPI00351ACA0E